MPLALHRGLNALGRRAREAGGCEDLCLARHVLLPGILLGTGGFTATHLLALRRDAEGRADPFAPDRVKNSECGDVLGHVVNAKERSSAGQRRKARGDSPGKRALNAAFDQRAQKPLSRGADENGTTKIHKLIEPGDDLDVLQRGLSECNSGIKDNARPRDRADVARPQKIKTWPQET